MTERNRHEQTLESAKVGLGERVFEHTRQLEERIAGQERAEQALRGLSARLLQAQDQDRRRIARELHVRQMGIGSVPTPRIKRVETKNVKRFVAQIRLHDFRDVAIVSERHANILQAAVRFVNAELSLVLRHMRIWITAEGFRNDELEPTPGVVSIFRQIRQVREECLRLT